MWQELLKQMQQADVKALARSISLVENEQPGYETLLQSLPVTSAKIIGITGPPGAGKSTLADALIGLLVNSGKKVAVLCIDPSSPFNLGALLGDRIRMSDWYTNPNVFIRSLATRGSMGGLHPKIIEITDLLKAFQFDNIIVETVGVGQSEIEIAGLADVTVVVVVPEAGDEIQTMKAGLMEIGDMASAQRPVYTLAITQPKWVRAYVSEVRLGRLVLGMSAAITTDSRPGQSIPGRVGAISSVAEFTPKTVQTEDQRASLVYEVRVLVGDPQDTPRLGMPATVHLRLQPLAASTRTRP